MPNYSFDIPAWGRGVLEIDDKSATVKWTISLNARLPPHSPGDVTMSMWGTFANDPPKRHAAESLFGLSCRFR
eukprot:15484730-Alexandrium_andersonii.AAC.1